MNVATLIGRITKDIDLRHTSYLVKKKKLTFNSIIVEKNLREKKRKKRGYYI
jgi:single-stranded DNA-binding protein